MTVATRFMPKYVFIGFRGKCRKNIAEKQCKILEESDSSVCLKMLTDTQCVPYFCDDDILQLTVLSFFLLASPILVSLTLFFSLFVVKVAIPIARR